MSQHCIIIYPSKTYLILKKGNTSKLIKQNISQFFNDEIIDIVFKIVDVHS